jgi:hypothetical protein
MRVRSPAAWRWLRVADAGEVGVLLPVMERPADADENPWDIDTSLSKLDAQGYNHRANI